MHTRVFLFVFLSIYTFSEWNTHFAVFKTTPLLTDCSTFHREEEKSSQILLLLCRKHYFNTQIVTISSRVGRRFGRRCNVFLPQWSGPLGGRAFEFELLNVVPAHSGRFWFAFRLRGTQVVWGVFLSAAWFFSAFVSVLTGISKRKRTHFHLKLKSLLNMLISLSTDSSLVLFLLT